MYSTYIFQSFSQVYLSMSQAISTIQVLAYNPTSASPVNDIHHRINIILTPWCRVLLEMLTGLQLVKKFPAFHGTRRFITTLTSFRHLSLSWASPIQSIYPHTTSCRSTLILSTHLCLGLPSGLFPSGFPIKTLYTPSPHPYAPYAKPISFFSTSSPAQYWVRSIDIAVQNKYCGKSQSFLSCKPKFLFLLTFSLLSTCIWTSRREFPLILRMCKCEYQRSSI